MGGFLGKLLPDKSESLKCARIDVQAKTNETIANSTEYQHCQVRQEKSRYHRLQDAALDAEPMPLVVNAMRWSSRLAKRYFKPEDEADANWLQTYLPRTQH